MQDEIKPGDRVALFGEVSFIEKGLATVILRSSECRLVLTTALMQPAEMFEMASAFDVLPYDATRRIKLIQVVRRSHNPDTWAIVSGSFCLAQDGEWESELQPSSRTDEFLNRCRWSSASEAIRFAQNHLRNYPSGYKSV